VLKEPNAKLRIAAVANAALGYDADMVFKLLLVEFLKAKSAKMQALTEIVSYIRGG